MKQVLALAWLSMFPLVVSNCSEPGDDSEVSAQAGDAGKTDATSDGALPDARRDGQDVDAAADSGLDASTDALSDAAADGANDAFADGSADANAGCGQGFQDWVQHYRDQEPSEMSIQDCSVETAPPGTYTAYVPENLKYNQSAPDEIEVVMSGTELISVDGNECEPVWPGNLSPASTEFNCDQKYVCGCCVVSLRHDDTWAVHFPNSWCDERTAMNEYEFYDVLLPGECDTDNDCESGEYCATAIKTCVEEVDPCKDCIDSCKGLNIPGCCACSELCLCNSECDYTPHCPFG